jgi:PAS domain S-box-containing protein
VDDERLTSLRAELARLAEDSSPLGAEAAEELTLQVVLTVVTALPEIVAAVSPDGRFLFVNRVVPGLSLADVIGTSVYDFMPPDSGGRARAAIGRVVRTGGPAEYLGVGPGVHGPESQYQTRCLPILGSDGVIAVALVVTDVTEAMRSQAELRNNEARLQLALSASGAGLWAVELDGETTTLDPRASGIMGLDAGGPPDHMARAIHPEDLPRVVAAFQGSIERGDALETTVRLDTGDEPTRWVAIEGVVLQDERGKPKQLVGTVRDITERHQLEEQLRQSQKLEAVGQLTAGIAHNFNNLLAIILPNIELARDGAPPTSQAFLAHAEAATLRAAEMVRQLMTFSGKNRRSASRTVALAAVVDSAVGMCRATFDRAIELVTTIEADAPDVEVDPGELEQALLNVLINARDAVEEAGRPKPRISVLVERGRPSQPGRDGAIDWVAIRIVDNGNGMDEAVRQRAMEPFFTTKEVGKGTGLGLAMTYALVRGAGGHIEIVSHLRAGASVSLYLPGAVSSVIPDDAPRPPTAPAGPRVLVVDDEPGVQALVKVVLERAGFEVDTASDGASALRRLADAPAAVMILDLSMPGMPWRDTLSGARDICPGVKVLIYTGLAVEADGSGADGLLQKPATHAQLLAAVNEVLHATEPAP